MDDENQISSDPDRRRFLILAAAVLTGSKALADGVLVDAGPATDYAADGVYSRFRDQGFFIVRRGSKLFALSAYCTHRRCKLAAEADRSFLCKCHGSTFDVDGKVTLGPAKRDLAMLSSMIGSKGHLLVRVPV